MSINVILLAHGCPLRYSKSKRVIPLSLITLLGSLRKFCEHDHHGGKPNKFFKVSALSLSVQGRCLLYDRFGRHPFLLFSLTVQRSQVLLIYNPNIALSKQTD